MNTLKERFEKILPPETTAGLDEAIAYGDPVALALNSELRRHLAGKEALRAALLSFFRQELLELAKEIDDSSDDEGFNEANSEAVALILSRADELV